MKNIYLKVLLLFTIIIIFLSVIATASVNGDSYNIITDNDFLHVNNGYIVNKNEQAIVLHGVNLGGWLLQEQWMCAVSGSSNLETIEGLQERGFTQQQIDKLFKSWQDNWITETDIKTIADTGCNVVRVPFWYRNFMTDINGTWIDNNFNNNPGFQKLDWVIQVCQKYGMYVILDMHGCPGGQSTNHSCGVIGENKLYTNQICQNTMKKLWQTIASRYKNNPVVAAYDIMNEPQNNNQNELKTDGNYYDPWNSTSWNLTNNIYNTMIKAIRAVDSNHIITIEGIWRVSNLPNPANYGWTNMMYQLHLYDNTTDFETYTKQLLQVTKDYGVAGYVGEFSNSEGMAICNKYNISWTSWTYKGVGSTYLGYTIQDWKNYSDYFWYGSNVNVAITNRDNFKDTSYYLLIQNDSYDELLEKWGERLQTKNLTVNTALLDKIKTAVTQKLNLPTFTTTTTNTNNTSQTLPTIMLYDVNEDTLVDSKDCLFLKKYIANYDVYVNYNNSDINQDNIVNIKDILLIMKYLSKTS